MRQEGYDERRRRETSGPCIDYLGVHGSVVLRGIGQEAGSAETGEAKKNETGLPEAAEEKEADMTEKTDRAGEQDYAGGVLLTEDAEEQDRQGGIWVLLFTLTAALGCGIVITVKKKKEEI